MTKDKKPHKHFVDSTDYDHCDHEWQEEECSADGCEDITKWCNKCHTYVLCDGDRLYNM